MKYTWRLFAFVSMPLLCSASAFAQPSFEIASVKPSGAPGPESATFNPGSITMRNVSLRRLISWAWETPRGQISSPEWIADALFDISAKAADAAPVAEMRLMMRSLLAERLGVRVHEDRRETTVYFLTVAKNGPRLHEPSPKDNTRFAESAGEGEPHFGRNGVMLVADHIAMPDLADQLSDPLQRPVVDKTGLAGRYDVRLDPTAFMTPSEGEGRGGRIDTISMILTAIPSQLGLKVDSGKDTVRFLVVDAVNRTPSEN